MISCIPSFESSTENIIAWESTTNINFFAAAQLLLIASIAGSIVSPIVAVSIFKHRGMIMTGNYIRHRLNNNLGEWLINLEGLKTTQKEASLKRVCLWTRGRCWNGRMKPLHPPPLHPTPLLEPWMGD